MPIPVLSLSDVYVYKGHTCVMLDTAFYALLIFQFCRKAVFKNSLLFPYSRSDISLSFFSLPM